MSAQLVTDLTVHQPPIRVWRICVQVGPNAAPGKRRSAPETAARIRPVASRAPCAYEPTWPYAPRCCPPQNHNVPGHSPPPGQRLARSQSPSAPVAAAVTVPGESLPTAAARGEHSSGSGCARSARARLPAQRHTTTLAFFFTTAEGRILTFEFVTHACFGLRRPLAEGSVTQPSQFLD